jgi:hypothetical protein
MILRQKFLLFFLTAINIFTQADNLKKMIVKVAVANLRAMPQAHDDSVTLPTSDFTNPLQITQVLLGEHLLVHECFIDHAGTKWCRVNALQQESFDAAVGWHGLSGWMQADQLLQVDAFAAHNIVVQSQLADLFNDDGYLQSISIGTRLCGTRLSNDCWQILLPDQRTVFMHNADLYCIDSIVTQSIEALRAKIITTALGFLESYYSWGGRKSAQCAGFGVSSVDCSALINLSFLACGLQIPRMSHEQFLRSGKIQSGKDLQQGDLIFSASIQKNSTRMDHVMMYLGNDQILESTFAGESKVRIISSQNRLGKSIKDLMSCDVIEQDDDQFQIYFGTFFKDAAMIQKLRDDALRCESFTDKK